jgi:hypothetical protein
MRAVVGYHPWRGGRYDSREDRSPTPEPLGTRMLIREIRTAIFPQHFRQPTRSTSTWGRRTLVCGLTTIVWHASWAEPPPTRSSSTTCRCTSQTRRGRGSSTCHPVRSTTGTTWSAPLWGTSRARTCALGTPGICKHAARSPVSRSGTSYGTSPSVVQSSRASPSPRSCTP